MPNDAISYGYAAGVGACVSLGGFLLGAAVVRRAGPVAQALTRRNPSSIAPTLARYVHATEIAPNSRQLHISGQIGVDRQGRFGKDAQTQCTRAFENMKAVLHDAHMDVEDLVKVTVFLTDRSQLAGYRVARDEALGDLEVASSLVIVKQLALEEMLVEIEGVAAKSRP